MPEGPEIRRAADKISKILQNRRLERVFFAFEHLKGYESLLRGQTVASVQPRGKAMLIHLDGHLSIYSHNQLYGRWVTTRTDLPPKTNRQVRMALATARGTAWLLSASEIEVLDQAGRQNHPYLSKLGPDPLDPGTSLDSLLNHWAERRFSRRSAASLFLDQAFLAGVGNYLRSEILFLARLHPESRLPPDRSGLAQATLEIFRQSYETGGITNDPELVARLKALGWTRRDYRHRVFGRMGKDCYCCGAPIVKESLAGRRLYWCSVCQNPISQAQTSFSGLA